MSSSPRIARDTFPIGTLAPTALIPNQTGQPWLTVWNVGSGSISIGGAAQVVGALKQRSFFIGDDDPIQALFTWGQRNPAQVLQPGQRVRNIPFALADQPLASLEETDLYASPILLLYGTAAGNTTTVITPNPGEVYTHIDAAYTGAQASGIQQEQISVAYGQGANTFVLIPPTGVSRQVVRIDGPTSLVLTSGSPSASLDWQIYGVANVLR